MFKTLKNYEIKKLNSVIKLYSFLVRRVNSFNILFIKCRLTNKKCRVLHIFTWQIQRTAGISYFAY